MNYYTAWKYVTKEDIDVEESDGHPDLWDGIPPRTMAASTPRAVQIQTQSTGSQDAGDSGSEEERPPKRSRSSRLSNFEFSEIVRAKNLKTRVQLLSFVERERAEGKTDIAKFIFSNLESHLGDHEYSVGHGIGTSRPATVKNEQNRPPK